MAFIYNWRVFASKHRKATKIHQWKRSLLDGTPDVFARGKPSIAATDPDKIRDLHAKIDTLKVAGTKISMDGKGRFLDNIFIERLWRSLKYECVYLHVWSGGREAKMGSGKWMNFYNTQGSTKLIATKHPMWCIGKVETK